MIVHELDCCPMHVRLRGNPFTRTPAQYMPARCLLLEFDDRLVLVDTGIGADEVAHWRGQLSAVWVLLSRGSTRASPPSSRFGRSDTIRATCATSCSRTSTPTTRAGSLISRTRQPTC